MSDNKFDLHKVTSSLAALLIEIDEQWSVYVLHIYCYRRQREYITHFRTQSTDKTYIIAQIDFTMNYTLLRQREVQQGFFSQHQATRFTAHLIIGLEHRDLAIVSDCMKHATSFVYCAQKLIITFVKKHYPAVQIINYFR
jgi:hypothetical protein